jgi:hypothetical protein
MITVYAAHPVTSYGTPYESSALRRLETMFDPDVELVNPATQFESADEWLQRWPELVIQLDAVVAFAARDRTVGLGVLQEVHDAMLLGISVAVLAQDGLRELAQVTYLGPRHRTPRRVARLVTGRRISPQTLLRRRALVR